QAFVYAYAFGSEDSSARAAITYPASGRAAFRRLELRRLEGVRAAEISLLSIPIVEALVELNEGGEGPIVDAIRRLSRVSEGTPVVAAASPPTANSSAAFGG